jgi:hypothetical protein
LLEQALSFLIQELLSIFSVFKIACAKNSKPEENAKFDLNSDNAVHTQSRSESKNQASHSKARISFEYECKMYLTKTQN